MGMKDACLSNKSLSDEEDLDELPVVDRVPKLLMLVGDGLKLLTIDAHLGVTLDVLWSSV
jgi:hypothetical protein